MLKRGIFIAILVLLLANLNGQEISNRVLVVSGNVANGGGYSISQTIGESMVDFVRSDGFDLTQGFQQPACNLVVRDDNEGSGVNVFPNPVVDNLKVDMWGETDLEFELTIFGLDGSIYHREDYFCPADIKICEVIDVSKYKRGLYFARITTANGKIARLFKIEKM